MEHQAREYEPFLLYGKSLEEYFRDKETVGPAVWHENKSVMWPILDKYQQDGYQAMLEISNRWGGSLLCDGVGLGKTFVGLMLIERLTRDGKNVLLLSPKSAFDAVWEPELNKRLPFLQGWGTNFKHLKHTDLIRKNSKDINWEDEWEAAKNKFDCIIVDEAHNFRNREKNQRFARFMEFINEGKSKQVFFLTATPINNSILDLKHMIDLFTNDNDSHFNRAPLSITSIYGQFRRLRAALALVIQLDGMEKIDLSAEIAKKEAQRILRDDPLIRALVVQRSRGYVKESQKIFRGREIQFPEPEPPRVWKYDLRKVYGDLLDDFQSAFGKDSFLKLSIYSPYEYYRGDITQLDDFKMKISGRKQVANLIRIGMLKAFESSVHAFESRCNRMMMRFVSWLSHPEHLIDLDAEKRIEEWKEKNHAILMYAQKLGLTGFEDDGIDEDEEEDDGFLDLPKIDKNVWSDDEFELQKIIDEAYADLEQLVIFIEKLRPITPEQDAKLEAVIELVRTDASSETGKVIIFTEFMTTARYLKKNLQKQLTEFRIEQVDSQTSTDRTTIVRRFSPYYNGSSSAELAENGEDEIDVLISTDVLSEGLNLQDSIRLVNYDIHWNPVRLMQRVGRIDRRMDPDKEAAIVAAHPEREGERGSIAYWNFMPPDSIDNLINLYGKVTGKIILISSVFGVQHGHGLTPDQEMEHLRDFNEQYDGFETTDEGLRLTLDRIVKEHPELARKWKSMPYHVISGKTNEDGRKGVFFCYRIPEPHPLSDDEIERGVIPGWSTENGMGDSRWFFFDIETEEILDGVGLMPQMHTIIQCESDSERVVSLEDQQLRDVKKKVEKRIKNTIMRTLQAPAKGAKPRLVCWLNIS
jgi:superfamily II DNA or RNA helicase